MTSFHSNTERTVSRTGVYGIALQNRKILLVKQQRGPHAGRFDLPGGGIEAGETIECALQREFREEVAMCFDSMQILENLTAITKGLNNNGDPYFLHQIGLIYRVEGLTELQNQTPEMEYFWITPEQLSEIDSSPFLNQIRTTAFY